jgi:hypothetical protein
MTLNAAIEIAKQKAAGNAKWIRAIDRAAAGLQSGELIVTLLHNGALVTSPRGSYFLIGTGTAYPTTYNARSEPEPNRENSGRHGKRFGRNCGG